MVADRPTPHGFTRSQVGPGDFSLLYNFIMEKMLRQLTALLKKYILN